MLIKLNLDYEMHGILLQEGSVKGTGSCLACSLHAHHHQDLRSKGKQGNSKYSPILIVGNVQAKDRKKTGVYESPVYKVKKRTGLNYITSFPLRTDEPASKWTLRGVALLASID